ncbi:MAG: choice-of-anchor D domain-containing protein, partial [Planctomycetes bacterium]|nr:choice-of-anchor D domain-containing protein [Planctomycetota bacterium]
FKPADIGAKSITILISNNDSYENPYTLTVTGTGTIVPLPEINIKQGNDDIPCYTGFYDFGSCSVNSSSEAIIFTIENIGYADLNLTGSPIVRITGLNAFEFSVNTSSTNTTITPGNSTTFTITLSPTNVGNKAVIVSISSNDSDENPYFFTLTGIGTTPLPEINIKQGSNNIPNSTGSYNFHGIRVGASSQAITFTIENTGYADLNLTGSPIVLITGTNASEFSANTSSTLSTITFGNSTTFSITFSPTSVGNKSATVSIANNDSDENPYTFTIAGSGSIYTNGDVNGDGYPDIIVGAYGDDDGGSASGCAFIFFGRSNWNSSVDASNADVKLIGEDIGDYFGRSVSFAGDVNNDGYGDIIVGAYSDDDGGIASGCAFIFFGKQNWNSSIDASNADVKLIGADIGDSFGYIVSSAGDVNNDEFDDVIVGAYGDDDGGSGSGCAFIFFGRQNWNSSIDASNANVKLIGENSFDYFATSVSSAGDVNRDGFDDVIVGAYYADNGGNSSGCAYIFFGRQNWNSSIDASNANVKLIGEYAGDFLGYSVSGAGDVNNDNFDDVIVSAHAADFGGNYAGCAYIFFGRQNWNSSIDASNANVTLIGEDSNDYFGRSVSTAGDVNNDGFDDLIIGVSYDDDGGINSGCAFIFLGKQNWASRIDASNADVKLIGGDTGDFFGYHVSSIQDVNNDGYQDVIVGAPSDDDGGVASGCAFIFFGKQNWSSNIDVSNADVKLIGADYGDALGASVSGGK